MTDLPVKRRIWTLTTPCDYDVALAIIEQVAFGRTLRDLENDPDLPTKEVFMLWLVKNPELNQLWQKAREISSYALEDEALHTLREQRKATQISQNDLKATGMLIEQLRWSADKRNTAVFGAKGQASLIVPIQINTTLDLGEASQARGTAEFPNIYEVAPSAAEPEPDANPILTAEPASAEDFRKLAAKREADRQARLIARRKAKTESMRRARAAKKEKKDVGSNTPDSI